MDHFLFSSEVSKIKSSCIALEAFALYKDLNILVNL